LFPVQSLPLVGGDHPVPCRAHLPQPLARDVRPTGDPQPRYSRCARSLVLEWPRIQCGRRVHGAEAVAELERVARTSNCLGPDITYIHCTAISDKAWKIILDSGGTVSLRPPRTQIRVADGSPPVQKCLDLGIDPSISIDLEACLASDMFSQISALLTIQRMVVFRRRAAGDEAAPALLTDRQVLHFATIAGATANGLGAISGSISPGKQADIIGVRTDDPNVFPLNNVIGTLVQGADSRNIEFVMIGVRPLKWQRTVLGYDVEHAHVMAQQSRVRLLAAAGVEVDLMA